MNPQPYNPFAGAPTPSPAPTPSQSPSVMPNFGGASTPSANPASMAAPAAMANPTLPHVSPATDSFASFAAAPTSFDADEHKMLPVVEDPLDVNQVPDTPAPAYNPFAAAPTPAPTETPSSTLSGDSAPAAKKSGLVPILLVTTFIFAITTVVFVVLWLSSQAALRTAEEASRRPVETPVATAVKKEKLTCSWSSYEEAPTETGLLSTERSFTGYFADDTLENITFNTALRFSDWDAANTEYTNRESGKHNVPSVIEVSNTIEDTYVYADVVTDGKNLRDLDVRGHFAYSVPMEILDEETGEIVTVESDNPDLSLSALKAYYEGNDFVCAVE